MTFVSYAQNFEDVMLWRALRHVERGFYVDVGAAWPEEHSVTKAFYDRGWCGVNIEPNPRFHAELEAGRTRDQNVMLAVGEHEEWRPMAIFTGTGLSTLDETVAAGHEKAGWRRERLEVQVTTLAKIWEEHVPGGQEVHFLKVDVEGLEDAALRGNDWSRNRPWITVVEATRPLSQVGSHEAWEPVLLGAGYQFAYADGLNRFYVSRERAGELLSALRYPPNCFDDFAVIGRIQAEARAAAAGTQAEEATARATAAERRASVAEECAARAEAGAAAAETRAAQIGAVLSWMEGSISWRLTKPLRALAPVARLARGSGGRRR